MGASGWGGDYECSMLVGGKEVNRRKPVCTEREGVAGYGLSP
jgi:hypothetical protein